MLQAGDLNLRLLFRCSRYLVKLALTSPILKPGIAQLRKFLHPRVDLLIPDVVLERDPSIVIARCDAVLGDLNSLFQGCIS